MPLSVRYDPSVPALVFDDGARVGFDDGHDIGIIDEPRLADVTVGDLTDAMAAWAADEASAHVWLVWPAATSTSTRDRHLYRDLLVAYDFDARELRGVVCLDIEPDEDPALVEDNRLVIRTATQAA